MTDSKQARDVPIGSALKSSDSSSHWENIPKELKALPQWVCAYDDKIPKNPRTGQNASVINPATWGTYEEAVEAGFPHIGFVFRKGDPYVGIDLDAPRNDEERARHNMIFEKLQTYTELSISGKGLHLISQGNIPHAVKRDQVEVYDTERYFILTGNVLPGRTTDINDCSEIINKLTSEMGIGRAVTIEHDEEETKTDADVYNQCLHSKNGDKFKSLWDGVNATPNPQLFAAY